MALCSLAIPAITTPAAVAHQSGCHAAHSCPSDTGSYVCGDTGIYTYCPGLSGTASVSAYGATAGSVVTASFYWAAYGQATYQWYRAGVAISGATGTTYTVTVQDLGQAITVSATATDGRGQTATTTTAPFTPTASITLKISAKKVKAGKSIAFSGGVTSLASAASLPIDVNIWQRDARRWRLRRTVTVITDVSGAFAVKQKTSKRKATTWRTQATFAGNATITPGSSVFATTTTKAPKRR